MKRPSVEPPRWTDGVPGDADVIDRRAADLLKLPAPLPLGPVRRARIQARLATERPPSLWWPVRRAWLVAAAAVALAAVAAGAIAAIGGLRDRGAGDVVILPPPAAATRAAHKRTPVPAQAAPGTPMADPARDRDLRPARALAGVPPTALAVAPSAPPRRDSTGPGPVRRPSPPVTASSVDSLVTSPVPAPAPSFAPAPPATPAPPAVVAPSAAPTPTTPSPMLSPSPPAPASEARLLADARAGLQAARDAAGALALLRELRRRFPTGTLVLEARVTEVEALLELGRRSEALALLDGLALDQLPRGDDVGVLRGELRAEMGRCREAIADFDRCADGGGCRSGANERALFGRASCRASTGQREAARADLEIYLGRFPHGRFAGAARRALGGGAAIP